MQCTPNKIHARQTNAGYNVHLNVVLELMAVDRIFDPVSCRVHVRGLQ